MQPELGNYNESLKSCMIVQSFFLKFFCADRCSMTESLMKVNKFFSLKKSFFFPACNFFFKKHFLLLFKIAYYISSQDVNNKKMLWHYFSCPSAILKNFYGRWIMFLKNLPRPIPKICNVFGSSTLWGVFMILWHFCSYLGAQTKFSKHVSYIFCLDTHESWRGAVFSLGFENWKFS